MSDMSRAREKLDALEALGNEELIERGWKELRALCGSDGRPKRWAMTIPVDADQDSDVLFGEILKRFAQLETKISHLRIEMEPFIAQIDQRKIAGLYEYD